MLTQVIVNLSYHTLNCLFSLLFQDLLLCLEAMMRSNFINIDVLATTCSQSIIHLYKHRTGPVKSKARKVRYILRLLFRVNRVNPSIHGVFFLFLNTDYTYSADPSCSGGYICW